MRPSEEAPRQADKSGGQAEQSSLSQSVFKSKSKAVQFSLACLISVPAQSKLLYTFLETFSCACVTSFYCLKSCCWSGSSQPSPKLMLINSGSGYIHGLFFTTLPKFILTELNIVMYGHNICFNAKNSSFILIVD